MKMPRGILGLPKDPKKQILFQFNVPKGEEWPDSDSEDSDYVPDKNNPESAESEHSVEDEECEPFPTTSHRLKRKKKVHSQSSSAKLLKMTAGGTRDENRHASPVQNKKSGDRKAADSNNAPIAWHTLPPELWLKIFQQVVNSAGALPFLCRASRVCRLWWELSCHPSLWNKMDLSFGWIKSCDNTLMWLASNRLSQCREISLSGWKNVTNNAIKVLSEKCSLLAGISLSRCSKLTSPAINFLLQGCPNIREFDLSFMSADVVSAQTLKQLVQMVGINLTSLNVAGNNLKGFHLVLNSIMEKCGQLKVLDISNCIFSTDFLVINVEKFQACCPQLQTLHMANCKVRANQVSQKAQLEGIGFTRLRQLSCAMPSNDNQYSTNGGISDDLLRRLLHHTRELQLLDLRGCTLCHPSVILESPALNIKQLYLSQSSITRHSEMLPILTARWRHSLQILDLAWTSPQPAHLHAAVTSLTDLPSCPLQQLNLAGTTATVPAVLLALKKLRHLNVMNLTSCRSLPRGVKCIHQGKGLIRLTNALEHEDGSD